MICDMWYVVCDGENRSVAFASGRDWGHEGFELGYSLSLVVGSAPG